MNDEMKETQRLIEETVKEAKEENRIKQQQENMKAVNKANEQAGLGSKATKTAKLTTVSSQADYDALPSGSLYLDSEGNQRKKK